MASHVLLILLVHQLDEDDTYIPIDVLLRHKYLETEGDRMNLPCSEATILMRVSCLDGLKKLESRYSLIFQKR